MQSRRVLNASQSQRSLTNTVVSTLAWLGLVLTSGCSPSPLPLQTVAGGRTNLLLISIDTLLADRLALAGEEFGFTQGFDTFEGFWAA